ncbi:BTAD domain-containing putative transcriptional regulator [Streptomyces sp. NPDC056160]|uniref:AfsR/SARP family transcriptional regulator n=1 Tax=Streptomyces sp. NPDC056160 TaxID=3345731 RepID=UPI0035E0D2ED
MIVRVLGPLRVTVNGTSVVPTAAKAKKLMAMLVLNRGRVVQRATIERELWDLDAPRSASTGIQNCVMWIRKGIGCAQPGDAGRLARQTLITEPTGYRLEVPGDQFDVVRHQRLVAEAATAEAGGDLAEASALLNAALNLWRDAPLADVPAGPVLRAHVRQLEEDRKAVLTQRLALDLRLRRYAEVVGELHALVALDPYDEVLHEYLMLALYLSGRRNDALTAYRQARRALADGVGLEPSHRLRGLQERILASEEAPSGALPGWPVRVAEPVRV